MFQVYKVMVIHVKKRWDYQQSICDKQPKWLEFPTITLLQINIKFLENTSSRVFKIEIITNYASECHVMSSK